MQSCTRPLQAIVSTVTSVVDQLKRAMWVQFYQMSTWDNMWLAQSATLELSSKKLALLHNDSCGKAVSSRVYASPTSNLSSCFEKSLQLSLPVDLTYCLLILERVASCSYILQDCKSSRYSAFHFESISSSIVFCCSCKSCLSLAIGGSWCVMWDVRMRHGISKCTITRHTFNTKHCFLAPGHNTMVIGNRRP